MARYFIDGKEITESEAVIIQQRNKEIMLSTSFVNWENIKFITKIN